MNKDRIEKAVIYIPELDSFERDPITAKELALMSKDSYKEAAFKMIKKTLYSRPIVSPEYKVSIVIPSRRAPHFRRTEKGTIPTKTTISKNESPIHAAFKIAIASAKRIKVKIYNQYYILEKQTGGYEIPVELLGAKYIIDRQWTIINISDELKKILGGNTINFEIHHTSAMDAAKIRAFSICGLPTIEFDIDEKYIPSRYLSSGCSQDDRIGFLINYYENIEKHYIQGTYIRPLQKKLRWHSRDSGRAKAQIPTESGKITIVIFVNQYETGYGIHYILNDKHSYRYKFNSINITSIEDAKNIAEYEINYHLSKKILIDFK